MAALLCAVWLAVLAPSALAEGNGVALTPPMGWNDWYSEYCGVSAQSVEQTAREMIDNGMAAAGYRYVNIDDCWMAPYRDSAGNLVADPSRFPNGIAPVAAYVHSLGLKLGIYEDAGTATCAGLPGSFGHEAQDAATFASWGVDYVKYDRCNIPYGDFPGLSQQQVDQTLFTRMSSALRATGRPIVFAACDPNPGVDAWTWGPPVANVWRTTPDIEDNYGSMLANFEGTVDLYKSAGPGGWNDPDLLQIGNGGSTPTEYQTEFSLWAEMSAPLIASTNLADLSPAALAVYENEDVIAVDQDPLGRQGVPISSAGGLWVLTKPLSDGERSLLLFNSTNTAATITTSARAAGLRRARGYSLFNLWSDAVSETAGQISAFVPAHGVAMFRVAPQARRDLAPLAPHTVLSLAASPSQIQAGATTTVSETFANQGTVSVKRLTLSLFAPSGWRVKRLGRARHAHLAAGRRFTVEYLVTAPATGPPLGLGMLAGSASYDPVAGLSESFANFGEIVSVPVAAPFTTADTTGLGASFGASDGSEAISASGLGVLSAFDAQAPVDSYAAVYEPGAAGPSSSAQVTVTSDQAGGSAGGAGLIQRDQMTAPAGSGPAVALFVGGNNTINMVWNASGGPDVDTWLEVPGAYAPPPVTLRLVRSGDTYTGYYSTDRGATWRTVDTVTVAPSVASSAQDVGEFHASGLDTWETTATFEDLLVNGVELR
ncbi:MAG TPA: NEW3 domain-containing protein [Solirubrobacteraceae bacterium]|nr:NEW3 domain-containing protein [Solirubrobacteraceae bacterium]